MLIIGSIIILLILSFVFFIVGISSWNYDTLFHVLAVIAFLVSVGLLMFGCFHGFINYPVTEGTHQGVITAVDLEGVWFRRYEVYLKSSGYTNQSDETKYLCYDYEAELIEQLKNAIGKTVKIHYGHDGGYIPWNSCGTYHIKSIEIIDED